MFCSGIPRDHPRKSPLKFYYVKYMGIKSDDTADFGEHVIISYLLWMLGFMLVKLKAKHTTNVSALEYILQNSTRPCTHPTYSCCTYLPTYAGTQRSRLGGAAVNVMWDGLRCSTWKKVKLWPIFRCVHVTHQPQISLR